MPTLLDGKPLSDICVLYCVFNILNIELIKINHYLVISAGLLYNLTMRKWLPGWASSKDITMRHGWRYISPQQVVTKSIGCNPVLWLTIYQIYAKFIKTGSVADNYRGNISRPRIGWPLENIATTRVAFCVVPTHKENDWSAQCYIHQSSVWTILNHDLGIRPYHVQIVEVLSSADRVTSNIFIVKM